MPNTCGKLLFENLDLLPEHHEPGVLERLGLSGPPDEVLESVEAGVREGDSHRG